MGQGRGRQSRQIKTPTSVPTVPGATGDNPEPKPVAKNVISFLFKTTLDFLCGLISLRFARDNSTNQFRCATLSE
jgi:hypothetical protein